MNKFSLLPSNLNLEIMSIMDIKIKEPNQYILMVLSTNVQIFIMVVKDNFQQIKKFNNICYIVEVTNCLKLNLK